LVNDLIRRFIPEFQFNWLINTGSARSAVIAMDLWKDLPFFAILVLSGLQFISGDIYEAAKVDGANSFQIFFKITLPLIIRNIITLCIPFTLWRLTSFDLVYAMFENTDNTDIVVPLASELTVLPQNDMQNLIKMFSTNMIADVNKNAFFSVNNKLTTGYQNLFT